MAAVDSIQPKASTSKDAYSIDPELFKRIQPAEYLSRFLKEGFRPDGRGPTEFRRPALNTGSITTAHGSCLVRLGETTVLCGIRAEVAEPDSLAPNSGFLVTNVELPAICSSKFRPGPPGDEAQVISSRINDIATASSLIPLHSLCIQSGKAVWVIYADIICINYDGNVTDAALLALVSALKHARIPKATWDEDTESAVALSDETVPLSLSSTILSATFGVSESGNLLCDPTSFEEPLCQTYITIALDEQSRIRHFWQAGPGKQGSEGSANSLVECLKLAKAYCEMQSSLLS